MSGTITELTAKSELYCNLVLMVKNKIARLFCRDLQTINLGEKKSLIGNTDPVSFPEYTSYYLFSTCRLLFSVNST